ncbi:LysR family transcriptional regulator [Pseudonocardia sp. H11422]|uniref:LysR family transcriptional regulator n=1 Tax=Pseudonocardia sp. H11422 TaxID=2835866 RepID=UPI0027E34897|nr:LysR family transcriptional regulator [Pseudonocardia sp. H11422]
MYESSSDPDAVARVLGGIAPRLRQFVAVARAEHVTRAADEIGVPQSTLSRGIARLEADLGIPLFARSGRTVRLTRAGRAFLQHAERALAELDAGARELVGDADPVRGRVCLAFLHTLGGEAVPRLLREFRAAHPGIRFDLVQGAHHVLLDRLRGGEVDLCLTSPLPTEPGLAVAPMHEQELRLAVPAEHPLTARRDGLPLADASGAQFVGFRPGYGLRSIVDAWCREAGFTPQLAFEGGDVETLRGLVGAGLGVALLPPVTRAPAAGVVELPVTAPRTTRTIGLVWVRDRPAPPPVRALRDFVLSAGPRLLDPREADAASHR